MKRLNGARINQGKASRVYPIGLKQYKSNLKTWQIHDFVEGLYLFIIFSWRWANECRKREKIGDILKVLLGFIEKVNVVCLFSSFFQHSEKLRLQLWSTRINVFSSFIVKIIEYESQFEFVGKTLPGERGGVDRE